MGFFRKDKKRSQEADSTGAEQEKQVRQEENVAQKTKTGKGRVLRFVFVLLLIVLCAAGIVYYFYFYRGMRPVMGNTVFRTAKEEKEPEQDSPDSIMPSSDAQNSDTQDRVAENSDVQGSDAQNSVLQNSDTQGNIGNFTINAAERDEKEQTAEQKTVKEAAESFERETDEEVLLPVKEPVLEEETICGADGPILDYADDSRIIFHGYYGLFVYDRDSKEVTGAVDLQEIGCQYTQGDSYCDTMVDLGGEMVFLHPIDADDVYIYYVEKQILTRKRYADSMLSHRFRTEQTQEYVEPDYTVWRSEQCALLAEDAYLYLETGSGLVNDLFYVIEQEGERQTYEHLLDSYLSGKDMAEDGEEIGTASAREDNDGENGIEDGMGREQEPAGEEPDAENEAENETDGSLTQAEPDIAGGEIDVQAYSEEEFRNLCREVDYRKLLREQEIYLNSVITVELTVLGQVDGGLFDDNVYYICTSEDKKGYTRYYVIRDDRTEEAMLIMEGDVLRIYGQFFDTCECPAEFLKTRAEIPALTMAYCDLLDE